ncbi:UDP-3-O-(3-hydroxymyristoyl)glucosamine N-acyltransferase [Bryobacter aggregatus]|uniref:UDP-3-O-(3-hydroxymyristoyl)glucosamine N-acyltransferase n=1 Tax=Bryobacter aggregatus TaxID=360054 RepID=UPI00068F09F9|nr:UDP-3-O-(3-hydroxymyristoyl)glucosamine N-acyltransferase [Bryobacter aggregatus]
MRVRELAENLKLSFEGDGEIEILGAAELERATSGELSFVAARKFWPMAQSSAAGCLIVTMDYPSGDRTLIRANEPRSAFAHSLQLLFPPQGPTGIHPSAVLEADVELGANVSIGAHCTIGKGVKIGDNSIIHPHVTIYAGVEIGARAVIHSGCVLGADGFGFVLVEGRYRKFPQVGRVRIGDDVEIGANSCIDRAALGVTLIGSGVKIDNLVHIAHNCQIGENVVIAAQTGLSGGVTVGAGAIIGGQVGIGDKARIEAGAVLGSGCGVLTSKIVRAGQPVWGTPARPLKEYLEQLALVARLPEMRKTLQSIAERQEEQASTPDNSDPTDAQSS